MVFKRLITASALLASAIFVTGCGEDIAVTASAPTPPLENIPFDAQKAEAGSALYETHCDTCHGADGLTTGVFGSTAILHRVYATPAAIDNNKLAVRSFGTMPNQNPALCDYTCQENIQHYFYKKWTDQFAAPNNFQGSVDLELAAVGKGLYDEQCVSCHGDFGGNDGVALMDGQYFIRNGRDMYSLDGVQYWSLSEFIAESMPNTAPGTCDSVCADAVSEYLRSWTYENGTFVDPMLSAPGSSTVPTQQEIDDRVAAGEALYVGASDNACIGCHGADGSNENFDQITDSARDYDQLVNIIANGEGSFMPACKPVGNCAEQLTDYIWVQFLGNTLTTDGGTSP